MKKCHEVMTKDPACCLPTDTVDKVAKVMHSRDIGSVPIIVSEQSRKLTGIVTDRDLAVKVVAERRDLSTSSAAEVMTRKVMTVREDDDVQLALDMMAELQLRRIPVVDHADRLVGILSQADVATRVDQPHSTAAVVKGISESRGVL